MELKLNNGSTIRPAEGDVICHRGSSITAQLLARSCAGKPLDGSRAHGQAQFPLSSSRAFAGGIKRYLIGRGTK